MFDYFNAHYDRIISDPFLAEWEGFVIKKESNSLIGIAGFINKPDAKGEIEMNIYIHPSFHRNGYGTEIALSMKKHYFDIPEVRTIVSPYISLDNSSAIKILEKMRMSPYRKYESKISFILHKSI